MGPTDSLQSAACSRQSTLIHESRLKTQTFASHDSPAPGSLRRPAFEKRAKLPASRGVAQLPERLGLDLPDALARDGEALSDLLQRVLAPVADAEPHLDHLFLARRQRLEDRLGL